MIRYRWSPALDEGMRDEVRELVRAAAAYDAEAGFTAIDEDAVDSVSTEGRTVLHLPIEARRDLARGDDVPWVVVAYLLLEVDDDGDGTVRFVVHPDYRSRGVATLLVEELGLDVSAEGGWAGTGARSLTAWAYGSHPASERLTSRFGVPAVRRQWTLMRPLAGPWARPLDEAVGDELGAPVPLHLVEAEREELLGSTALPERHSLAVRDLTSRPQDEALVSRRDGRVAGLVWFAPDLHEYDGFRAAWIGGALVSDPDAGKGLGSALVTGALIALRGRGAQLALMRIDPDSAAAVRMCRLLGFEQVEAHACYRVGTVADEAGDK